VKPSVDLHIHSVFSDGSCTVEAICAQAVQRGVQTIALSDHDTTAGLASMQAAVDAANASQHSLTLIPAIEVSSGEGGLTHVLGYGVRAGAQPLENELITLKRLRVQRNLETIRLLEKLLGIELLTGPAEAGGVPHPVLGRMHVARLLIERHIVSSTDEAFRKYLGVGKPAYLPLSHMTTEKAISVIRSCGAIPVLAHPVRIGVLHGDAQQTLLQMKSYGLMGLEVFHPSASRKDVKRLHQLAQDLGLLITGGSDFHGEYGIKTKIGEFPAGWQTWEQDLETLYGAIAASAVSSA
jgi:3',5'-nucleoside bisphosphate phosphatase